MKNLNLTPDAKLKTESEILDRLASIQRNRDTECAKGQPREHIVTIQARQKRIAHLTEREGLLLQRLKDLRSAANG